MFSFFKKKASKPAITDIVFATKAAKFKSLAQAAKADASAVFVAWFDESKEQLAEYFAASGIQAEVISYHEINRVTNKPVFIEHYPLAEKEINLFETLQSAVTIYSSLDEPLFRLFGGDRISSLLTSMGIDENEGIRHSMITRSVYNAQEKLAKKITVDRSARSMEEWMQKNVDAISS